MKITSDYHTHPFQTSRDYDGVLAMARRALDCGFDTICFTEHAPLAPTIVCNRHHLNMEEYELYLECAERCRREFAGKLQVLIGIEADFHPDNLEQVARLRSEYPFDHVGGSLHIHAPFWKEIVAAIPEEKRFDFALDRTEELIESGLYDSVNHLDFFRWKLVRDYDPESREERFRDLFSRMARRKMKLELNVSGVRKDFQSFLPCREVWDWSLDYPLERYYGSDAHDPSQLGCETDRAAEWLAAAVRAGGRSGR